PLLQRGKTKFAKLELVMYEITIKTNFSAAHYLKGYEGKCSSLHGHNWMVEISVLAEKIDSLGMGIDFYILKGESEKILKELDHKNLNDIPYFKEENPSSENIARFIYQNIKTNLHEKKVKISWVKVSETLNNSVTYWE
ncbi:MAG: 6-carboxytetrahydropterin synthase QueD, partial [bacterium]